MSDILCAPYAWDCEEAMAVAACESRLDPLAVGSHGERGLFQIHPIHAWRFPEKGWTWDDAFDPAKNTAIAYEIYSEQGWTPWTCR